MRAMGLVLGMVMAGILLAGCTISSTDLLIAPEHLATPLPAAFALTPYKSEDGTLYLADREAGARAFKLEDGAYVSEDGSLALRFEAREAEGFTVAASSPDGEHLYGWGTISGDILVLEMILDNPEDAIALLAEAEARGETRAAAAAIEATPDGIRVSDPQGLALVISWVAEGALRAEPMVVHVGREGETAPESIAQEGDSWRAQ
ncbi:hypothetical protein SAMN02983003_1799 [Devosia enhydra]|uniref:Uncharacterized protein n=1 Tax=Devosia enhydra TaxID=665118 RepID=A0A1K2HX40_9HYPH|nr:hypothetical protein [Devosia enhydra]SFZ83705.1 hypothetical protein SAMN02983003_1799 [Devosia enhydra]